eukprot:TRINITY_DN25657_c0_g1_i1.p1 TRINITY_DN25657_c0_g1~~TRINITY_DN25657_c0_g1_i1.p1  ORF type:complete len:352 (-),score=52.75 TRINITY_DN25657_c0_g1_i1:182-1237(-)
MSGAYQPPSLRTICAVVLFIASYALLAPGLTATLFSMKADVKFLGTTMPVLDITKSTIGTISHLYEGNHFLAAGLICLFSVFVPFFKLAVIVLTLGRIACSKEHNGSQTQLLIAGIQAVSKWATVDAFCIMTFAAAFAALPNESSLSVDLHLHAGFYCFLSYCILSVAAAALLPAEPTNTVHSLPMFRHANLSYTMRVVTVLAAGIAWIWLLTVPLISFEIEAFGFNRKLSVSSLMIFLAESGLWTAAASVVLFVGLLPGLQILSIIARELDVHLAYATELWHFTMADVFLVSTVVTVLASTGLSSQLHVKALIGARLMLAVVIFAPLARRGLTAFAGKFHVRRDDYVEEL